MSEVGGEQTHVEPSKALRESLEAQGLFVWTHQGIRERTGGYDYVYEAVVLGPTEVEEVMAKANSYEGEEITDPAQLKWEHVKDRPEVHEGEGGLDSLQGAIEKFFGG
jgi:hypothetical protein